MRKNFLILLLLIIAVFSAFFIKSSLQPDIYKHSLESEKEISNMTESEIFDVLSSTKTNGSIEDLKEADGLHLKGIEAYRAHNYKEADVLLQKALKIKSDFYRKETKETSQIKYTIALNAYEAGEYQKASDYLKNLNYTDILSSPFFEPQLTNFDICMLIDELCAKVYYKLNNCSEAYKHAESALDYYELSNFKDSAGFDLKLTKNIMQKCKQDGA